MKKTSNPFFSICCQSYITEAASRFFRTEPTNISKNDPDSNQESDNLTATSTWPTEDDVGTREVKEEDPLASVSALASPRPGVSWELCAKDAEAAHIQYETQQGGDDESRVSQEAQSNGEDEFAQTADEDAGLVSAEDAKEDKQDEDQILCTYRRNEALEGDEYVETINSRLTGDAMSEGGGEVGAEESEEAIKQDEVQKKDENVQEINDAEENGHIEDKVGSMAEDSEVNLCMTTALSMDELNAKMKEKMMQKLEEVAPPTEKEVDESDVVLLLDSNEGNEAKEGAQQHRNQLLSHEKLPDEDQDFKEPQSLTLVHAAYDRRNSMSDDAEEEAIERKQEVVTEEENVNELEEDINLAPEECQKISVDTCNEKSVPSAETDLQTVECTDGESVDVSIYPEVQTERKYDVKTEGSGEAVDEKADLRTTDIYIDDRCLECDQIEEEDEMEEAKVEDEDQEEEEEEKEELSGEVSNNEEYPIEATCTSTSVTVDSEGETVQETSREFKNIPPGVCEGQPVVPRESPLCEEAQGGVPEHNNEPGGDENTTQRFLEERDSKEVQSVELPEEVESLHNTGSSHGADYLLVKELIEEEEESEDDIKCSFDSVVEEHGGKLCLTEGEWLQDGKASFVEQTIQDLSADSMKTGDTHLEQEFKVFAGLSQLTEEQQDETGELLVEFEMDGCVLKEAGDATDDDNAGTAEAREVVEFTDEFLNTLEAEVQKMTEMSFDVEPENAANLEQSSCRIPSLQEELSESGCVEKSVESEPRLFEDSGLDFQGAEINVEKTEFTVEEDAEEDDVQKEISEKHVDRIATAEWDEKVDTVIAESEIVEIQNQLSDEALEISIEESEVEPKTKDVSVISAEETDVHVTESGEIKVPVGEPQDVIDEEILDLWIQTTEEDNDDIIHQEGPEPGKQMDGEMELGNEEPGEISSVLTEKKEEPLVKLNSGDPDSVNDTEVSSATAELRLWDPEMMTSTTEELIHDVYDLVVDTPESEDLSVLSLQQSNSESQDILSDKATEKRQSYLEEMELITETELDPGSGFNSPMTRHLSGELEETQEKAGEEGVSEIIETDVEVMDLTEDADFHLLTKTLTSFKVEDPMVEDELLSDSQDELKQAEREQYKSGSEASSEEDDVEDSGSPQPGWLEDADLLPGLNRTEVEEELTPEFGDLMEVLFYIYILKHIILEIIHNLERSSKLSCFGDFRLMPPHWILLLKEREFL